MQLKDFDYELPEDLIAQFPLPKRDEARLMVIDRAQQKITHDRFFNIGKYLPQQSLIVINNSKVIPARLLGRKERSGGKVEIFLLNRLPDGYSFRTLLRPLRKVQNGDKIIFNGNSVVAEIKDWKKRIVRFNRKDVLAHLDRIGHMPLPPYIKRPDNPEDRAFYQTVYARHPGSVASPTAGLHFTKELLSRLKKEGHAIEPVTLHVNYATFKEVEVDDITQHPMQAESYSLSAPTAERIQQAQRDKRPVVAIGTTACRVLETMVASGKLKGETNLFIYPGYSFQTVNQLVTNFHLPRTSLLMLAYAFGSPELIKKAYREAIEQKYRFYSYGDAMMII